MAISIAAFSSAPVAEAEVDRLIVSPRMSCSDGGSAIRTTNDRAAANGFGNDAKAKVRSITAPPGMSTPAAASVMGSPSGVPPPMARVCESAGTPRIVAKASLMSAMVCTGLTAVLMERPSSA